MIHHADRVVLRREHNFAYPHNHNDLFLCRHPGIFCNIDTPSLQLANVLWKTGVQVHCKNVEGYSRDKPWFNWVADVSALLRTCLFNSCGGIIMQGLFQILQHWPLP